MGYWNIYSPVRSIEEIIQVKKKRHIVVTLWYANGIGRPNIILEDFNIVSTKPRYQENYQKTYNVLKNNYPKKEAERESKSFINNTFPFQIWCHF